MKTHWCIFVGPDHWRVATVRAGHVVSESASFPPEASVDARVEALRTCLASQGYTDAPTVLACPSAWFLCAAFSTDGLERARRRKAMAFRMEEHLPVAAEDLVADFVEVGGSALGVCGELATLKPLIDAMESRGICVRHISPQALLAAAQVVDQLSDVDAVISRFGAAEGGDLIEIRHGKPTAWAWLADDGAESRQRLAAWEAAQQTKAKVAMLACSHPVEEFGTALRIDQVKLPMALDDAAALQAARVLEQSASPWIDLRRDSLAAADSFESVRKPMTMLAAAMALLMICVIGATQWRGRQYAAQRDEFLRQQSDVFRAAMPNQRVPASIKGRLMSEHQKLAGLSGKLPGGGTGGGDGGVLRSSALSQLQVVLLSLPGDLRYRILNLSLQPDRIRVDGQARSHAEAERIAAALRETGTYAVEPPKTEALKDGGVSFVFAAKPLASDTAAKEAE